MTKKFYARGALNLGEGDGQEFETRPVFELEGN